MVALEPARADDQVGGDDSPLHLSHACLGSNLFVAVWPGGFCADLCLRICRRRCHLRTLGECLFCRAGGLHGFAIRHRDTPDGDGMRLSRQYHKPRFQCRLLWNSGRTAGCHHGTGTGIARAEISDRTRADGQGLRHRQHLPNVEPLFRLPSLRLFRRPRGTGGHKQRPEC